MSRIRSKNTKPELLMFELLESAGIEFERHYKMLGNPDIVFPEKKLAVFIDGEFWHGRYLKMRKDRLPEYWVKKITHNIKRDKKYRKQLREEGWDIIQLWEDSIRKDKKRALRRVLAHLGAIKQP